MLLNEHEEEVEDFPEADFGDEIDEPLLNMLKNLMSQENIFYNERKDRLRQSIIDVLHQLGVEH